LPTILERLGCQVVAINASMEEAAPRVASGTNEVELMNGLAAITRALPTELGVAIDEEGERISLADGEGRVVPPMAALAALAVLSMRVHQGGTVAVPVTAPGIMEPLAERYGGRIVRTKVDAYALMAAASREGVVMAGDGRGGFIFPRFHPTFDGMMAIVQILEMLAITQTTLAEVVSSLPPFYLSTEDVRCAWEQKARVMRELNERYRDRRGRHIDGVKIELGDEWVLVLPDAVRPLVHVIAEGREPEQAAQLAKEYASVVSGLQR
jgi:mannose-1-phosphate guanylyltransferase/phosphomannomutase